jgi:hypothetical protein
LASGLWPDLVKTAIAKGSKPHYVSLGYDEGTGNASPTAHCGVALPVRPPNMLVRGLACVEDKLGKIKAGLP